MAAGRFWDLRRALLPEPRPTPTTRHIKVWPMPAVNAIPQGPQNPPRAAEFSKQPHGVAPEPVGTAATQVNQREHSSQGIGHSPCPSGAQERGGAEEGPTRAKAGPKHPCGLSGFACPASRNMPSSFARMGPWVIGVRAICAQPQTGLISAQHFQTRGSHTLPGLSSSRLVGRVLLPGATRSRSRSRLPNRPALRNRIHISPAAFDKARPSIRRNQVRRLR